MEDSSRSSLAHEGEMPIRSLEAKPKKLTREDSPPPDPGIVRDMTPLDIAANIYVGPDVNIMFFSDEAFVKLMRGEKVILVPDPKKKHDINEVGKEFSRKYPASRSTMNRIRREWGR